MCVGSYLGFWIDSVPLQFIGVFWRLEGSWGELGRRHHELNWNVYSSRKLLN